MFKRLITHCIVCLYCAIGVAYTNVNTSELVPYAFVDGHLKDYSEDERALIMDDLANIQTLCFRGLKPSSGQLTYVATAGGPGASKSTIMESYLQIHPGFVYADPDQRALKFMINTYISSLNNFATSKAESFTSLLKECYTKWRAASNYIALKILNQAFDQGFNIAHGTTSTAKEVAGLYERLKQKNYRIVLLLCGSGDDNRVKAIENRSKTQLLVQNSAEDTINKGKSFPERFPVYFQYADEIIIYWTDDFAKGSVKAATMEKGKQIVIHDREAYNKFLVQYPTFEKLYATQ
jgi:hypothetical protein